jgi:hypothetical protein
VRAVPPATFAASPSMAVARCLWREGGGGEAPQCTLMCFKQFKKVKNCSILKNHQKSYPLQWCEGGSSGKAQHCTQINKAESYSTAILKISSSF